jgi:hypothetical protein
MSMVRAGQKRRVLGDAIGCKAQADDCDANAERFCSHINLTRTEVCCTPAFVAKNGIPSSSWQLDQC